MATIAPIVMKLALENNGLTTQDLYDCAKPVFRQIYDAMYVSEEGGDWLPVDPKTGQPLLYIDRSFDVEKAETVWGPEPPPTDQDYEGEGELYSYIEVTTDDLQEKGWVVYEGVTPSESGDQYTIKVTDEGRKHLEDAANPDFYEEVAL